MSFDLFVGGLAIAYGLFTLVARFVAPHSGLFRKLGPMQERFGKGPGTALHWAAYTLTPLAFGGVKLAQALLPAAGK